MRPVVRKAPGAAPRALGLQRHYATQRSEPTVDAAIDFDLRTIAEGSRSDGTVKAQPVWLDAIHAAMHNRKPNFQLAVGMAIPYRKCPIVSTKAALDVIAGSWIACKPLLTLLTER